MPILNLTTVRQFPPDGRVTRASHQSRLQHSGSRWILRQDRSSRAAHHDGFRVSTCSGSLRRYFSHRSRRRRGWRQAIACCPSVISLAYVSPSRAHNHVSKYLKNRSEIHGHTHGQGRSFATSVHDTNLECSATHRDAHMARTATFRHHGSKRILLFVPGTPVHPLVYPTPGS